MTSVIVFDLDDTLYPERDYVRSGFLAVDAHLRARKIDGFFDAAWKYFVEGGRGDTFNIVLATLGVPSDEDLIRDLVTVYREHLPDIALSKIVSDVLATLQARYRLGLITDGFAVVQRQKLAALDVSHFFEKIVVTDDLGAGRQYWKPHARPYQEIQTHFQVDHQACMYVADNPAKDFVMAKRLGWATIQVAHEGGEYGAVDLGSEYQADHIVGDLRELLTGVAGLEGQERGSDE